MKTLESTTDVRGGCSVQRLVLPIRPYHQEASVTIYHGDCRQIAPLLGRFDLLLTDPPYGIGKDGQKRTTGGNGGRKAHDFLGWDSERPEPWLLQMLLAQTDKQIIWGGNYFADCLPPTMKWLVWDKGQRINQSDGELAYTSESGALRICTMNRVELLLDGTNHPTQKPEKLMRWCIEQAGDVQTILDPFAGSGTTGRAAKDLGKTAVLIEREERFCEIAARRLSQDVLALDGQNTGISNTDTTAQNAK
jgi:site-specific DNA-methyltransferase (adenine-specific)